jgi:hypothetical protein
VDCPPGIWDASEYEKLPGYDEPTPAQPAGAFFCHQQNGRLCSGWVAVHDMGHSLGLRLALSFGHLDRAGYEAALHHHRCAAAPVRPGRR